MKPLLLLFIPLMACQQSQTLNQPETTFKAYLKAKSLKNASAQVEYLHPKIFDGYSKDSVIKTIEALEVSGPISVGNEKWISSSEVVAEKGIKYALITFSQTTTLDMSDYKNKGGADFAISLSLEELRRQHGTENVFFDEDNYVIKTNTTSEMYAVLDPEYASWKFLNKTHPESDIAKSIVPETIRTQLN